MRMEGFHGMASWSQLMETFDMRSFRKMLLLGLAVWGCGPSGGDFDGPHGIKALHVGGYSYAYVVPVPGGVVVVDGGGDAGAAKIKEAVGDRAILAVLLTHAHSDHAAGLDALGDVPVLVGRDEVPLLKGDEKFKGVGPRTSGMFSKPPVVPRHIVPVDTGHVFAVGAHTFTAVTAKGHTAGSTAWLYADVLFSGDAVLGGKTVDRSPWFFDDDIQQSDEAVKELMSLDFKFMLDGHNGQTDRPQDKATAW
jgi:glyoxylase-like metal-dependent hydrolase (beta-lactamase superfamily II)